MRQTIGQSMKAARERAGLSAHTLARKSGVPYNSVLCYERDESAPGCLNLISIADTLGVTLDELVGRDAGDHR